ncbi:hypothetical protein J437_LFUL016333 [Ladona fulva]|uniref:Uncharacterized protein n=1 Tax=Ladona fulva TaxID=123851 RepID=A0A8K0KJY5_LADFU|nr:hypothetical protein J437_LFUL016333 [Ladona fulva]
MVPKKLKRKVETYGESSRDQMVGKQRKDSSSRCVLSPAYLRHLADFPALRPFSPFPHHPYSNDSTLLLLQPSSPLKVVAHPSSSFYPQHHSHYRKEHLQLPQDASFQHHYHQSLHCAHHCKGVRDTGAWVDSHLLDGHNNHPDYCPKDHYCHRSH